MRSALRALCVGGGPSDVLGLYTHTQTHVGPGRAYTHGRPARVPLLIRCNGRGPDLFNPGVTVYPDRIEWMARAGEREVFIITASRPPRQATPRHAATAGLGVLSPRLEQIGRSGPLGPICGKQRRVATTRVQSVGCLPLKQKNACFLQCGLKKKNLR